METLPSKATTTVTGLPQQEITSKRIRRQTTSCSRRSPTEASLLLTIPYRQAPIISWIANRSNSYFSSNHWAARWPLLKILMGIQRIERWRMAYRCSLSSRMRPQQRQKTCPTNELATRKIKCCRCRFKARRFKAPPPMQRMLFRLSPNSFQQVPPLPKKRPTSEGNSIDRP